ncbi:MAG: hypothetical protein GYA17_05935 [Chloroflexi bacterium]|nr:hypothetical protein [Chloroflexota bacterium]
MQRSTSLFILSTLAGLLALAEAAAGLFWTGGGAPFDFTTLHGQSVQINGQGLYFYDTLFKAPILRGTDAVTLCAALPLLVVALLLYRRGRLTGGLLLAGALAYLLYNAASLALGAAYNNLFLLYVAYFSASLFAFILAFSAIDPQQLAGRAGNGLPRGGMAALLFLAGLALLAAWLGDILSALLQGSVPAIASYTTEATYVFDLGIIAPLCFLSGVLLLRRAPLGLPLAAILLVLLAIVGVMVTVQTLFQMQAGITLGAGEFIGKAGSFMLLALVAAGLLARFFRCLEA